MLILSGYRCLFAAQPFFYPYRVLILCKDGLEAIVALIRGAGLILLLSLSKVGEYCQIRKQGPILPRCPTILRLPRSMSLKAYRSGANQSQVMLEPFVCESDYVAI